MITFQLLCFCSSYVILFSFDNQITDNNRADRGHGIAGTNERSIPDLSQTFLSAVNSRMEADLIPEMADLRDLSDPLFALARRMDSYKMCWRCIRPATSNLSTSALARQDELFVQSTSEITELVANLRLRLASPEFLASPGGGEQVAREACFETSAQIRRSLWTLEGRLYRRLCSMFNLRHVAWLARVPDLARAFEAVATLLPVNRHMRRRLLLLRGLHSLWEPMKEQPYTALLWSLPELDESRLAAVYYQETLRCTLLEGFMPVVESTSAMSRLGSSSRAAADALWQSVTVYFRACVQECAEAATIVLSLKLPLYNDANWFGVPQRPNWLEIASRQSQYAAAPRRLQPEPQRQLQSQPPQQQQQHQQQQQQRQQRTLWDFFSASQRQSVSRPALPPAPIGPPLVASQRHAPVSSPALPGSKRPPEQASTAGTQSGEGSPASALLSPSCPVKTCPQGRLPPTVADRKIIVKGKIPGASPWTPGAQGLYPRPTGAQRSDLHPTSFPVWNTRVRGMGWQQAMFSAADSIEQLNRAGECCSVKPSTFYVAADVWTRKGGGSWGLGKIFGAFKSPHEFVAQLLEVAHNRHFYEIIRAGRPCKAYFDLEAAPGVWDRETGWARCKAVMRAWEMRVQERWPTAREACPRCLAHMVLDGSRMTDAGWKVSYHVIYPWLVFPCNTTLLKCEAELLSARPEFQYRDNANVLKPFVDPTVYTNNRQFRLLLNCKLSDSTRTALTLASPPTLSSFALSCITYVGLDAWRVPLESDPLLHVRSVRKSAMGGTSRKSSHVTRPVAEDPAVDAFIKACLHEQGHPEGRLIRSTDGQAYRWETLNNIPRPCPTAQLWRPNKPCHVSNGAQITVNGIGQIFLRCLHSECRSRSGGQLWYVGTVPSSLLLLQSESAAEDKQSLLNKATRKRSAGQNLEETSDQPSRPSRRWNAFGHRTASCADSLDCGQGLAGAAAEATAESVAEPPAKLSPPVVGRPPLSLPGSMLRVIAENQAGEVDSFHPWHECPGPYGGRTGGSERHMTEGRCSDVATSHQMDIKELSAWSDQPFFSVPAPASLIAAVSAELDANNDRHADAMQGILPGWAEASGPAAKAPSPPSPSSGSNMQWSVEPDRAWYECPAYCRPAVGRELLVTARAGLATGAPVRPAVGSDRDLWVDPLVVSYLNIGFQKLERSVSEITQLILCHRPDVLFLGDLGVARNKVGRLKQRMESGLGDEWFMLTDISTHKRRGPVGMGVVVHCSLAKHVRTLDLPGPEGGDPAEWSQAVAGRILPLQLSREGCPHTWQLVGVYQHVAAASNAQSRAHVLATMGALLTRAERVGHRVVLIGDMNSAPEGGRWKYKPSVRFSRFDREMNEWVLSHACREIAGSTLKHTWAMRHGAQRAALDRAFIYPAHESTSRLTVNWHQAVFDHAMITVRLPHHTAGIGYAGACRPVMTGSRAPRCRVDLKKWKTRRDEWMQLLKQSLEQEDTSREGPRDPFQALKHAEVVAEEIARKLAPKRIPKAGELRRSFCFAGHRLLLRELNWLRETRVLVESALSGSAEFWSCPQRAVKWKVLASQLPRRIKRSGFPRPPDLPSHLPGNLTGGLREELTCWVMHAKTAASEVRRAAIRDDFAQARFLNAQNFRYQLMKSGGVLDQQVLQAALGKRQPRQRMWGLSGPAVLGVALLLHVSRMDETLALIQRMPSAVRIVRVVIRDEGHSQGQLSELQLWLRGPRQTGDFLVQWCTRVHDLGNVKLCPLFPPDHYVATDPDDMLAIQEWHMASEGMDTESGCPRCRSGNIQPITVTAENEPCGNPGRAVRYFCFSCNSVHDTARLNPLPPCPLPLSVLQTMRSAPDGIPAQISILVDYETLVACVRALMTGKSVGTDGIPREFYKYGPRVLLELLRAAINAYLRGEHPTVYQHEWMGAIVTSIAKQQSALKFTEFRPVASICTKLIILLNILYRRTSSFMERHELLEDAQEAFRKGRSTQRQLFKLQSFLEDQRNAKHPVVLLYLDIKNAFNAMNHRALFRIMEFCGYPAADIALFQHMYKGTFLFLGNPFGDSAACYLTRGAPQGAAPSTLVFNQAFNPVHVIARLYGRCGAIYDMTPAGSSGFADDTVFHTSGPDAVPRMQAIIAPVGAYLRWSGLLINMLKSKISAIDYSTGKVVATDSIRHDGAAFPVLLPDQAHKHLGMRMSLTGDFSQEKARVTGEMRLRLSALRTDKLLPPILKEVAIKIGVVSVFRYSAGLVPWSKTELDQLSKSWVAAYKQAWTFSTRIDSSPMCLDRDEGGRACPSAVEEWIRAVLEVWEQCIGLPGEISRQATQHLQRSCLDHGCYTLNQLQCLLRVGGQADSVLERLLLRLDEQGLALSSPWPQRAGTLIAAAVWPKVWMVWTEKQKWAGCRELEEDLSAQWLHVKHCLSACRKLGKARILTVQQLRSASGRWLHIDDLHHNHRLLSADEFASLTSWLDAAEPSSAAETISDDYTPPPTDIRRIYPQGMACTTCAGVMPPCLRGSLVRQLADDQAELELLPDANIPELSIQGTSDEQLARYLCQTRAVFPFTADGTVTCDVECLLPLASVAPTAQAEASIVVSTFQAELSHAPAQLAVMTMALVRDTLLAAGVERLRDACCRPRWTVPIADLKERFSVPDSAAASPGPGLGLLTNRSGQSCITGHFQRRSTRARLSALLPPTLYPWQLDPPLPANVTIDLANHHLRTLPAPTGWEILQRNGQTFITPPGQTTVSIDQAQFGLLRALHSGEHHDQQDLSIPFLTHLRESCLAQQRADGLWHVPWSRHLLACLHRITGAELLIGVRAVARHPHFQHYVSPFPGDQNLGAAVDWPDVEALLLLDSFAQDDRPSVWRRVDAHTQPVWILLQARPGVELSRAHRALRLRSARQCAVLSAKSRVVHKEECWSEAKWDAQQAGHETQLWRVGPCNEPNSEWRSGTSPEAGPISVQSLLGDWECYRYDFHWYDGPHARLLQWYQENQQDALRLIWTGIVAGTDGGVDWKNERMGAGYVTGTAQETETSFSASVGGPLSTLRAEGASLLRLLLDLRDGSSTPLLVFVDCLVLLDILQRWGQVSFHPHPADVVHFDVIFPLLDELRQRTGPVRLVKVKSHTGCLLNERADEWAERGFHAEPPEICPGPRKYGSVWLGIRPHVRESATQLGKSLPRDSAPNHQLLRRAVRVNTRRAVGMRSTKFVRHLLHQPEGATIARCVAGCRPAEYRVWVKAMADRYPVQSYLHRCRIAQSPQCPYCQEQEETLAHFTTICPHFREARTAGHNRVRTKLTSLLAKCLDTIQWQVFEETPMRSTGLELHTVSAACMVEAGRLPPGDHGDSICVGNLQPDLVLVSRSLKRIGLLDLCRPFDSQSDLLAAARQRKLRTYGPLLEALRSYLESGWHVLILPWVVGVRGMVDVKSVSKILDFLQVCPKRRTKIVEDVAIESVKALYSLHQIRYQAFNLNLSRARLGSSKAASSRTTVQTKHGTLDTDDPTTRCNSKRRRSADDDYGETRRRWKKMASDARGSG